MNSSRRQVFVCRHRTCRRQGSQQVKAAFMQQRVKGVDISECGCLGGCGNGVMVIILPDKIRYCRITPQRVSLIIEQHLKRHSPVKELIDPTFEG